MASLLPVLNDNFGVPLPASQTALTLNGTALNLAYTWNAAAARWFLDVLDANETPLLSGVPISVGLPLFYLPAVAGLPAGVILAIDTAGQDEDPGRKDLGGRVVLVFATPAEIGAA